MARQHSRNTALYVSIDGVGAASPVVGIDSVTMDFSTDKAEVSGFGDANKSYVAGLPDTKGTYSGSYDNAADQLFTASLDGVARNFYLYMNRSTPTVNYFYGTALFDHSIDAKIGDAQKISGTITAAGGIYKKP